MPLLDRIRDARGGVTAARARATAAAATVARLERDLRESTDRRQEHIATWTGLERAYTEYDKLGLELRRMLKKHRDGDLTEEKNRKEWQAEFDAEKRKRTALETELRRAVAAYDKAVADVEAEGEAAHAKAKKARRRP